MNREATGGEGQKEEMTEESKKLNKIKGRRERLCERRCENVTREEM